MAALSNAQSDFEATGLKVLTNKDHGDKSQVDKAFLGMCMISVAGPNAVAFAHNVGVNRTTNQHHHPIRIAVHRESINPTLVSKTWPNGKSDNPPTLKILQGGKVELLDGNHRVEAAKLHSQMMVELITLKKLELRSSEVKHITGPEDLKALEHEVEVLTNALAGTYWWVAEVYDLDAPKDILLKLSENATGPVLPQTPSEQLWAAARQVANHINNPANGISEEDRRTLPPKVLQEALGNVTVKNNRKNLLMSKPATWAVVQLAVEFSYFHKEDVMPTTKWIEENSKGGHFGHGIGFLRMQMLHDGFRKLALIASYDKWTAPGVTATTKAYNKAVTEQWAQVKERLAKDKDVDLLVLEPFKKDDKKDKSWTSATTAYEQLVERFTKNGVCHEVWPPELLEKLDGVFVKHLQHCTHEFGQLESVEWSRGLSKYWPDVLVMCKSYWEALIEQADTDKLSDNAKGALSYAYDKLVWVSTLSQNGSTFVLPLLSKSALSAMNTMLLNIQSGVNWLTLMMDPVAPLSSRLDGTPDVWDLSSVLNKDLQAASFLPSSRLFLIHFWNSVLSESRSLKFIGKKFEQHLTPVHYNILSSHLKALMQHWDHIVGPLNVGEQLSKSNDAKVAAPHAEEDHEHVNLGSSSKGKGKGKHVSVKPNCKLAHVKLPDNHDWANILYTGYHAVCRSISDVNGRSCHSQMESLGPHARLEQGVYFHPKTLEDLPILRRLEMCSWSYHVLTGSSRNMKQRAGALVMFIALFDVVFQEAVAPVLVEHLAVISLKRIVNFLRVHTTPRPFVAPPGLKELPNANGDVVYYIPWFWPTLSQATRAARVRLEPTIESQNEGPDLCKFLTQHLKHMHKTLMKSPLLASELEVNPKDSKYRTKDGFLDHVVIQKFKELMMAMVVNASRIAARAEGIEGDWVYPFKRNDSLHPLPDLHVDENMLVTDRDAFESLQQYRETAPDRHDLEPLEQIFNEINNAIMRPKNSVTPYDVMRLIGPVQIRTGDALELAEKIQEDSMDVNTLDDKRRGQWTINNLDHDQNSSDDSNYEYPYALTFSGERLPDQDPELPSSPSSCSRNSQSLESGGEDTNWDATPISNNLGSVEKVQEKQYSKAERKRPRCKLF
ncbi:uncharacterized protein BXZ73DRAFT_106219 [Epithele typhae]|uniref:uncharacterized protein n=1 Tax=Epithele typhae TaxID=378194 RepID=UPI00200898A5|nr:uncharacterized protein BXZ73DRAFT_106219 [Epithele typhae]KAH9915245.1 hypothetical protein BXZ73DRAFT_106219 [Epithele typhae]